AGIGDGALAGADVGGRALRGPRRAGAKGRGGEDAGVGGARNGVMRPQRCYNRRTMTEQRASALTTILFTDLVNSTQLIQRTGDEDAQRIFKAHYQLLRDAVSAKGGSEVKSLGDGLMVAFASAADAVRCAIMVQQASRYGRRAARREVGHQRRGGDERGGRLLWHACGGRAEAMRPGGARPDPLQRRHRVPTSGPAGVLVPRPRRA